jgi:uncharacterized protein
MQRGADTTTYMTSKSALRALEELYAETDASLAGWSCDASTDCCNFARTGREPYVWPIEWALLERAIAARGTKRGPLHVIDDRERACPLLGTNGRCTVYNSRPFGCRTYFCARASGPSAKPPRDTLATLGRRVAALAEQSDPECDGPRLITTWLRERSRR